MPRRSLSCIYCAPCECHIYTTCGVRAYFTQSPCSPLFLAQAHLHPKLAHLTGGKNSSPAVYTRSRTCKEARCPVPGTRLSGEKKGQSDKVQATNMCRTLHMRVCFPRLPLCICGPASCKRRGKYTYRQPLVRQVRLWVPLQPVRRCLSPPDARSSNPGDDTSARTCMAASLRADVPRASWRVPNAVPTSSTSSAFPSRAPSTNTAPVRGSRGAYALLLALLVPAGVEGQLNWSSTSSDAAGFTYTYDLLGNISVSNCCVWARWCEGGNVRFRCTPQVLSACASSATGNRCAACAACSASAANVALRATLPLTNSTHVRPRARG